MKPEKPDSFESSIVLSVVNECALAMDNAHNAAEKERAADLAKSEQLRADLLRSISHDCARRFAPFRVMRTPFA